MTSSELALALLAAFAGGLFALLVLHRLVRHTREELARRAALHARPDEAAVLRAERNRLRAEKAMLRQQLQARIDEMTETVAATEVEATRLRNALGETEETLQLTRDTLAERESEIAHLKTIVATLEGDLEKRTRELADTRDALRRTERIRDDLQRRVEELERENRRLDHRLEEARARLAALEKKLDLRDAEIERLRATVPAERGGAEIVDLAARQQVAGGASGDGEDGDAAAGSARRTDTAELSSRLMGQVIALDELAGRLRRARSAEGARAGVETPADAKAKNGKASAASAEDRPNGGGGDESEAERLQRELEELDRLWKERLAALRQAVERPSGPRN